MVSNKTLEVSFAAPPTQLPFAVDPANWVALVPRARQVERVAASAFDDRTICRNNRSSEVFLSQIRAVEETTPATGHLVFLGTATLARTEYDIFAPLKAFPMSKPGALASKSQGVDYRSFPSALVVQVFEPAWLQCSPAPLQAFLCQFRQGFHPGGGAPPVR